MGGRWITIMFLLALTASAVEAARIHGTVYNIELDPVKNARVEINTEPKQAYIATDGSYSFTVPNGEYKLAARIIRNGTTTAYAAEEITVQADGDYVLDLIVFPEFTEEEILVSAEEIDLDEVQFGDVPSPWPRLLLVVGIFALLLGGRYAWKKRTSTLAPKMPPVEAVAQPVELPATEKDYSAEILEFIRRQGGRTTQKDIRKSSPLSEAKISLIVAELEHKGLIEKIKKGRGNIIVLK